MSSWLGGLWGGSESSVDVDEEIAKLQYCTEEQKDLVLHAVKGLNNAVANGHALFSGESEEQAKGLIHRCIWACHYFTGDLEIVRASLELILVAIRPRRVQGSTGVGYLHLLYTDILFEQFVPTKLDEKKEISNMHVLLNLLKLPDFQIRYHLTSILQLVMKNQKTSLLQVEILGDPMAVATIVELLGDKETIRLQALGILLGLTKTHEEELQKCIAFSGAFEKALGIIDTGGYWGAEGLGTLDCLILVSNLLKKNILNQNYFRETSCIQQLVPLLEINPSDTWLLTEHKTKVIVATLDILFYLVTGSNPSISINQTEIGKLNILNMVITWALDRINSPIVRSKALFALGALLHNHAQNRMVFSQQVIRIARESTPQPTLHRLLTLAFHSSSFAEQVGSAYAFSQFLHENSESQLAIVTTLTPPPDSSESSQIADVHAGSNSIGRQLLKNLQDQSQPVSAYIASWILGSVLSDNIDCKQVALRIQLSLESKGQTLLVLCMELLRKSQARAQNQFALEVHIISIGIIRLLSVWMYQFPPLVVEFLRTPENLPFLVDLINQPTGNIHLQGMCALLVGFCFMFNENEESEDISSNRFALHGIICHRIGLDKFMNLLDAMRQSSAFQDAEKQEKSFLDYSSVNYEYLLYDNDFVEFVKNAKDQLLRDLRSPNKRKSDSAFKDKMKAKDKEIEMLQEKIQALEIEKAENTIAKDHPDILAMKSNLENALGEIEELKNVIIDKDGELQSLSLAYNDLESFLSETRKELEELRNQPSQPTENISDDTQEYEQAALIAALEEENKKLRQEIIELSRKHPS